MTITPQRLLTLELFAEKADIAREKAELYALIERIAGEVEVLQSQANEIALQIRELMTIV